MSLTYPVVNYKFPPWIMCGIALGWGNFHSGRCAAGSERGKEAPDQEFEMEETGISGAMMPPRLVNMYGLP